MTKETLSPFDYINVILTKKTGILPQETQESTFAGYSPFLANRSLSFHKDCVLWANEMNIRHSIPREMQYQFLYNTVTAARRPFSKWPSAKEDEKIEFVSEHFKVNRIRAREMARLISDEEIADIKTHTYKGGVEEGRSKKS